MKVTIDIPKKLVDQLWHTGGGNFIGKREQRGRFELQLGPKNTTGQMFWCSTLLEALALMDCIGAKTLYVDAAEEFMGEYVVIGNKPYRPTLKR